MKLYNEKEIGSILKRAAELSHDDDGSDSLGLSLDELKQLGKEAGINPDFILRAAAEMGIGKTGPSKKNIFGGPITYTNEVVLDGEISASVWEEMLVTFRNCFKDPGIVTTRENIYEWTIQSQSTKAQVTARMEKGKTKIHLFWAEPTAAIPFLIPSLIGTILSLPIIFEALNMTGIAGAMAVIATFSTLFFLGRWGISRYTDRQIAKLDQVVTGIELIAARSGASADRKSSKESTVEKVKSVEAPSPAALLNLETSTADEADSDRMARRERT